MGGTRQMNKRSRPKISESDLELFNRVVADVKPLKFQNNSGINKKNNFILNGFIGNI